MQRENSDKRIENLKPHRFQKGQSGNPAGRPKSAILSGAIRHKLEVVDPEDEQGRTYAEVIAEKLVLKAAKGDGDLSAVKEILDRTEGKARQTIHLTTDKREKLERLVEQYIREEAAEGRETDRESAIKTLSLFEPEVSQLLN